MQKYKRIPNFSCNLFMKNNLFGGGEWESNPPIATELRHAGFEDQESHQTLCASSRNIAQLHGFPACHAGLMKKLCPRSEIG